MGREQGSSLPLMDTLAEFLKEQGVIDDEDEAGINS
jgi:hypothetical protein